MQSLMSVSYTHLDVYKRQVGVLQRPIQQKVKIVKDISINEAGKYDDNTFAGSGHEDGFTQNGRCV